MRHRFAAMGEHHRVQEKVNRFATMGEVSTIEHGRRSGCRWRSQRAASVRCPDNVSHFIVHVLEVVERHLRRLTLDSLIQTKQR